jgi:hypothetical protein
MFKKTLIAAAVATLASSVAMADVSISGAVEQTFTDTAGLQKAFNNIKIKRREPGEIFHLRSHER